MNRCRKKMTPFPFLRREASRTSCDQPDPVPESESSLADQATMRFCALSASDAANGDPFLPAVDVSFELAAVELAEGEENVTGLDDEFSFDLLEIVNACELEL